MCRFPLLLHFSACILTLGWGLCPHSWGTAVRLVWFQRFPTFLWWPAGSSEGIRTGTVRGLVKRHTVRTGWPKVRDQVGNTAHCYDLSQLNFILNIHHCLIQHTNQGHFGLNGCWFEWILHSVFPQSYSLCIVSRPVTVWWTWTTRMAGSRSSIQTDWSVCSGRSGSSLPWALPSQPRYNRLLILQTNSTDKPLS